MSSRSRSQVRRNNSIASRSMWSAYIVSRKARESRWLAQPRAGAFWKARFVRNGTKTLSEQSCESPYARDRGRFDTQSFLSLITHDLPNTTWNIIGTGDELAHPPEFIIGE